MAKYTYTVTVTVPDGPTYIKSLNGRDGAMALTSTMADIVMRERCDYEEDYGFDYTVEWEAVK